MTQIESELLSLYRALVGQIAKNERLEERIKQLEAEVESAEAAETRAVKDLKASRDNYREVDDWNMELTLKVIALEGAADICLDLVGAVIERETEQERLHDSIMRGLFMDMPFQYRLERIEEPADVVKVQDQIVAAGGIRIMSCKEVQPGEFVPDRCLSCNGDKGSCYYICEECLDLDIDVNAGLFNELKDAWEAGERNFPRPGKNAKENK
jgi:hypothetical protein